VASSRAQGNAEKPLSGEGVLIELVQPPPHVVAAFETLEKASKQL
jgi:hypothetical protein